MIGDLYNFVKETIVGPIPIEFQFIIPIIVIIFCILIIYVSLSGFILLKDLVGGK